MCLLSGLPSSRRTVRPRQDRTKRRSLPPCLPSAEGQDKGFTQRQTTRFHLPVATQRLAICDVKGGDPLFSGGRFLVRRSFSHGLLQSVPTGSLGRIVRVRVLVYPQKVFDKIYAKDYTNIRTIKLQI
jgi:hypothetical protein